jgi:hypothetical protein
MILESSYHISKKLLVKVHSCPHSHGVDVTNPSIGLLRLENTAIFGRKDSFLFLGGV